MKKYDIDKAEMTEECGGDLKSLGTSFIDSSGEVPYNIILSQSKKQLFEQVNDKINLDTWYVFNIHENIVNDNIRKITRYNYNIEYRIANNAYVTNVTYDERALRSFNPKNKLWTRIKLAFKYIFKRNID